MWNETKPHNEPEVRMNKTPDQIHDLWTRYQALDAQADEIWAQRRHAHEVLQERYAEWVLEQKLGTWFWYCFRPDLGEEPILICPIRTETAHEIELDRILGGGPIDLNYGLQVSFKDKGGGWGWLCVYGLAQNLADLIKRLGVEPAQHPESKFQELERYLENQATYMALMK